jgi:hypothetical protein
MEHQILDDCLETLWAIRAEVYGDVESSVIAQLDEVIQKLAAARRENPSRYTAQDILMMVGKIIEFLPAIARLLEQLQSWL